MPKHDEVPITVLIADDHGVVREGLRAMLEREGFQVLGEASTGQEAIDLTTSLSPNVILLDIRMPDVDGLQALAAIKETSPETCIIVLTSYSNPGYLARAVAHGAAGFLTKDVDPDRIPAAVRAAASGEHLLDPALLQQALAQAARDVPLEQPPGTPAFDLLTAAEIRVLRLVATGLDNETIAQSLNLSIHTVKTHVHHILQKLNVSDRTQAALWAVRHGIQ